MSRSIITLDEAKDYINYTGTGTDKDSFIEWIIDLASGELEDRLGYKIAAQEVTVILDGNGESAMPLPHPIIALVGADEATRLSNLQYRTGTDEAWTDLVDDEDYIHITDEKPHQIELSEGEYFPFGQQNIRVNYYAGFDPIPGQIELVCAEMTAMIWRQSNHGEFAIGVTSKTSSGGVESSLTAAIVG